MFLYAVVVTYFNINELIIFVHTLFRKEIWYVYVKEKSVKSLVCSTVRIVVDGRNFRDKSVNVDVNVQYVRI